MRDPDRDNLSPDSGAVDAIKALIEEAQIAAASETALLRACGVIVTASLKGMALWGVVALLCAFVALLAFALGAVIALAPWTGAVAAMLIVPAILLGVAGLGAWRARANLGSMREAVGQLRP